MCGVFGIISPERDVFPDVVNGLFQMQHRGQDACGIALSDGKRIRLHKGLGYVREVFGKRPYPDFGGWLGVGHVRYPTQGGNRRINAQPHRVRTLEGSVLALASNGDLTNYDEVRADLVADGLEIVGSNDAEILLKFLAREIFVRSTPVEQAIRNLQETIHGAYSACLMTRDRLHAFTDPYGFRPLCFGRNQESWVVGSETNALDICHADLEAHLEPGEIVTLAPGKDPHRSPHPDGVGARNGRELPAHCSFEHIYFSRPDSITFGERVYDVRKKIGGWLAAQDSDVGDVVVPVPDSSNAVALGYAHRSGLPFEFGLIRNHYIGRTFISPDQARRDDGVRQKFNPLRSVFKDKRVILVDDSIVRGTTLRKLALMVRGAGALEVHLRIGSPVIRHSCYYGVDTPDADTLIGSQMDVEGIREHLTADSLRYISIDGLRDCLRDGRSFCGACFDGHYPVEIPMSKRSK